VSASSRPIATGKASDLEVLRPEDPIPTPGALPWEDDE
jgi:hypothetical protein